MTGRMAEVAEGADCRLHAAAIGIGYVRNEPAVTGTGDIVRLTRAEAIADTADGMDLDRGVGIEEPTPDAAHAHLDRQRAKGCGLSAGGAHEVVLLVVKGGA